MKDLFSGYASGYAAFRPTYPKELYDFILSLVKEKDSAWDCATGNGQVARDLAPHFKKVMATDSSSKQIDNAIAISNIHYSVSSAERTSFTDSSFDLITVGQAIHWLEFDKFYSEVTRVSKPGAILAVWGYGLLKINPPIDERILDFYVRIIGPYWHSERKLIDQRYTTIPFPFKEIPSPEFSFSFLWTLEELEGYLNTWSSVWPFIKVNSYNPVDGLIESIRPLWKKEKISVSFPLFVRCGIPNA